MTKQITDKSIPEKEKQELIEFLVTQFATFRVEYRDDNKRIHDRIDNVINELQQVKKNLLK